MKATPLLAAFLIACGLATTAGAANNDKTISEGMIRSTRALCVHIAQALNGSAQDRASLASWISAEGFALRVTQQLKLPDELAATPDFQRSLLRNVWFLNGTTLPTTWEVASFTPGTDEDRCALATDIEVGTGVFLADFFLVDDGRQPRIMDYQQYLPPVRASTLFAEVFQLVPYPGVQVRHSPEAMAGFNAYVQAHVSGNADLPLAAYLKLPPAEQRSPFFVSGLLKSLQGLDVTDPRRKRIQVALLTALQDQPDCALTLFDHFAESGDWSRARRALDEVESRFGSHYSIEFLRLFVLSQQRPGGQAFYRQAARVLTLNDAHLPTYELLLREFILDGRYEDAVLVLGIFVERFESTIDFEILRTYENGPRFMQSPAFIAWQKDYSARLQPAAAVDAETPRAGRP